MKKIIILCLFMITVVTTNAQFKSDLSEPIDLSKGIGNNSNSSMMLGFINMNNFQMNHQFDLSYAASGSAGIAMSTYTNTLSYKFSDKLNVSVDASIVNSPYNTVGKEFTNEINGIYLSRAQLNFAPTDNTKITIQYNNYPGGYYNRNFYSPFGYNRLFDR